MIRWLRDEHNRGAVTVVASVLALVAGGVWTVFVYFNSEIPAQDAVSLTNDGTNDVSDDVSDDVSQTPSTQTVDVDILHGHYDGEALFIIDQDCKLSGSIDWVNRVDKSTIIDQVVTGELRCETLTVERVSIGDFCTGRLTASGRRMSCRLGSHDTSFRFDTPIKNCRC